MNRLFSYNVVLRKILQFKNSDLNLWDYDWVSCVQGSSSVKKVSVYVMYLL